MEQAICAFVLANVPLILPLQAVHRISREGFLNPVNLVKFIKLEGIQHQEKWFSVLLSGRLDWSKRLPRCSPVSI